MSNKKGKDKVFILINDCGICKKLLQRQEISEDLNQKLPEEVNQLENISNSIKKCPMCGTFYHYYEWDLCPDPLEIPVRTYKKLTRLTYSHIKDLFLDPAVNEEDKKKLLEEWEELQDRYEEIIGNFVTIITTKSKTLNWQI